MRRPLRFASACAWLCAGALALPAGCDGLVCGPGTEKKVDALGHPACVLPSATDTPCNADAGAVLVGGVCVGDKNKFPTCGPGTRLDVASNQCLPDVIVPCMTPPSCTAGDKNTGFCVHGVVRYLKDDSCTAPKTLEVRAYEPFSFLSDPKNAKPIAVSMTDANGGYKFGNLARNDFGQGIVAIAVVDPGGPSTYVLSGSGAANVSNGNEYRVDPFAVEATLVASWDTQAGLAGNGTFEVNGAYLARFYLDAAETMPAAGVKLTESGMPATAFYFKGALTTIDKTLMATDASGAAILKPIGLPTFSGTGGGVAKWEGVQGASTAGVVFIQKFHPAM